LVIGYRGYDFASVIFRDDATANLQYITFGNNLASGGGSLTIEGNANVNVGNTVNLSYTLGGGTVTNNTLNLNGGTLTVAAFTKTQVTDTRHQSTINFNGTLLMGTYGGVMLPAFANLTANVQAGGVRIDDVGNTVEIDQPLIHDAALGATADGGLHKIGIGTLILGGNNTYTGTTTIDGGTLQLGNGSVGVGGLLGTGAVANSGAIVLNRTDTFTMPNAIADGIGGPGSLEQKGYGSKAILTSPNTYTGATTVTGGTLLLSGSQATSGVTVNSINGPAGFGAGTGGTTIQALTLGTSPSDTQTLVPSDGTNLTTINVASLVNNGATTITPGNLGVQAYTLGLHVLVDYDTISGAGSFGLSLPARVTGYLQTIGTAIDLNVTAVKYPKWNGNLNNGSGAGDWDIGYLNINGTPASGTQNWKEYTTGTSTVYQEGPPADFVYFDDSATGVTTVNLTTTVMPALVTVDNSTKNYTFIGPGSISGATALIKSGTGALVIANDVDNTYTGGTTINAGTIQLGNGGTTGFVPGNIVNNGALAFDRTDTALTISSVISGAGTVSQIGSGTTTLSGTNTFTGDTVISNGVLMLGTATTLQTSTLDSQGGRLSFGTTLTVATLGGLKGSQGIALTNDNATPANVALTVGNNNADTSYAGALTGGGSLTKIGTGTLTLTGSNVFSGATTITLGNIVVSGSGGLNTNAAITVGRTDYTGNAASLTFQNSATGTFASLNFGGTLRSGGNFTIQDSANVVMSGSFDLNNENPGSTVNSNNIVALNGGTLAVNAFILTAVRVNHLATMNFNGATLKPNGAITTGTYLPALSGLTANVQTGGAKFDDLGGVVQIDQPLIHDAALGTTLDGGLTKIGTGTLILTGANTYTGPTTVNNGLLQLATTGQIAADISTAATSATFQVLGGTHTVGNISGIGNTNLLAGSSLTASSIVQGTVTLGIGARITIAPLPGGPTAGTGSPTAVPEPSTWAMLMLAAMGLGMYWRLEPGRMRINFW
jgi:autotransporter-associated beta strand protein